MSENKIRLLKEMPGALIGSVHKIEFGDLDAIVWISEEHMCSVSHLIETGYAEYIKDELEEEETFYHICHDGDTLELFVKSSLYSPIIRPWTKNIINQGNWSTTRKDVEEAIDLAVEHLEKKRANNRDLIENLKEATKKIMEEKG